MVWSLMTRLPPHFCCSVFDYMDDKISTEAPVGFMSLSDLKKAFAFLGFDVRAPLVPTLG